MWSWPYFVDIAGPAALKGHCERLRGKAAQPGPGAAPDGPRATFFPLCSSESEMYFATSMGNRTPIPWLEVAGRGRQLSPTRVESPIIRLLRILSRQGPVKSTLPRVIVHPTSQKLLWGPSILWAHRASSGTRPSSDHQFAWLIGLTDSSRCGWRITCPPGASWPVPHRGSRTMST